MMDPEGGFPTTIADNGVKDASSTLSTLDAGWLGTALATTPSAKPLPAFPSPRCLLSGTVLSSPQVPLAKLFPNSS
jgi:hypothetical protein